MKRKAWLGLAAVLASAIMLAPGRAPAGGCDTELEAIGAVSASYLYTCYTAIGALADGYVNKTYEADQVAQMMGEQNNLLDLFVEQMEKMKKSEVTSDDKQSLDQMIAIAKLLKKEATALSAYVKSDKAADADKYDKARKAAWAKLKVLLDIKD